MKKISAVIFSCCIYVMAPDYSSASDNLPEAEQEGTVITYSPYPIIYYTPETSLGYGLGLMTTFRDPDSLSSDRPDNISAMITNTLNSQVYLKVDTDFYFNKQNSNLQTKIIYMDYPENYFGVGNDADISEDEIDQREESYTNNSYALTIRGVHKIWHQLRLGFIYKYDHSEVSDFEEGGSLEQSALVGMNGGVTSGLGPVIDFDNRDNIFYPSTGGWYQLMAIYHDDTIGSDFNYNKYTIDLRHFLSIKPNHIIALQGIATDSEGDIPFYTMSFPAIRGIYNGVFSNRKMVTGQAEYRFPIYEDWSGTAFVAAGDVYDQWGEAKFSEVKYAGGIGLRYALNPEEKINIRLDLAISPWGFAPYLQIQEKF